MRVVIYNTNSFGGNFNYSKELEKAYNLHPLIERCIRVGPLTDDKTCDGSSGVRFLSDHVPPIFDSVKKLYFIVRSFINPLKLYLFLRKQPSSAVIFNDFDQLTAHIWAPLFKRLKSKHKFAVILHDPDRDFYLPSKSLSVATMKQVMGVMDIAFYHESLPVRSYYLDKSKKIPVPHGIYTKQAFDEEFLKLLQRKKNRRYIISILGNVRREKSYEIAIEALSSLPDVQLLVAGAASSSAVSVQEYRSLILEQKVSDQVIWIDQFLSESQLQSAIMFSDIVLLAYKPTFSSQSGILNIIAPHYKKMIVGEGDSALARTVSRFQLGPLIQLNADALAVAVRQLADKEYEPHRSWYDYIAYASWENHVKIAVDAFNEP